MVIRLEKVSTDLVISYNLPLDHAWIVQFDDSAEGRKLHDAVETVKTLLNTLEITDWSLFGN